MNNEEMLMFRTKWVSEDVDWEELASLEGDERVDGSDPVQRREYLRTWGKSDVALKMSYLDFDHAGRWALKFRNQGFDTNGFSNTSPDEEHGKARSYFYNYVTSTDVCYYDAEFETKSRPAYDVALYAEAFRDIEAFNDLSEGIGDLFDALKGEDLDGVNNALTYLGKPGIGEDGSIEIDCFQKFGLLFNLKVLPRS